jgi:hypothetical protein
VIEVRSYRRVFELERRIYRIDRLRLNPGGVPVRGIVYFLVLAAVGALAGSMPALSLVAGAVPWYVRVLALPGILASLLTVIRLEGRPFHIAACALLRYWAAPHRLAGLERRASVGARWRPQEVLLLPDGSDGVLRRLRYSGPGAALVAVAHERTRRRHGRDLAIRGVPGGRALARAEVIALFAGGRLSVRPGRARDRSRSRAPTARMGGRGGERSARS